MTRFYPGWAEREPIPPESRPSPRAIRSKVENKPVELATPEVTAQPRAIPRSRLPGRQNEVENNFWVRVTNRA